MCGRFTQSQSGETIAKDFQLSVVPDVTPSYNIAPTQGVATVWQPAGQSDVQSERQFRVLRWGLIPSWAKEAAIGAKLINARAETVAEKPSFRSAFKQRRCLILADGFYEWQRQNGKKQPFYLHLQNHQPFAFAGLWERWQDSTGEPIASCTILTTEANPMVRPIHDRMPVILSPDAYETWLNPDTPPNSLQSLLHPYDAAVMVTYPVSSLVNKPANNSPDCLQPLPREDQAVLPKGSASDPALASSV